MFKGIINKTAMVVGTLSIVSLTSEAQANIVGDLWEKATLSMMEKVIDSVEKNKHQNAFCATGGSALKGEFSIGSFDGKLCDHRIWASVAALSCKGTKSYRTGKPFEESTCGKKAKVVLDKAGAWNSREKQLMMFADRMATHTRNFQNVGCKLTNYMLVAGSAVATGGVPMPPLLTKVCKKIDDTTKAALSKGLTTRVATRFEPPVEATPPVAQPEQQPVEPQAVEPQEEAKPTEEAAAAPASTDKSEEGKETAKTESEEETSRYENVEEDPATPSAKSEEAQSEGKSAASEESSSAEEKWL